MSQAITKTINLQDLLSNAKLQTQVMMEQGIDLGDPSVITPLESTANQYPEIALECNQILIELVKQQMNLMNHQNEPEIQNEF
jgi:hypothetical protein